MPHGKLGASVDRSGLRLHKVVDAPEITLPFPAAAQWSAGSAADGGFQPRNGVQKC